MKNAKSTKLATVDNATVNNATYTAIYNEFATATCKLDLVNALNRHGIRTNTTPTETKNANDLYVQLFDKSRVLITKKSLKVYTNDEHATAIHNAFNDFEFDSVNDGSYRTKRATVKNTVENFNRIFAYFEKCGCIAYLPTK